jgi:hypothetical protein
VKRLFRKGWWQGLQEKEKHVQSRKLGQNIQLDQEVPVEEQEGTVSLEEAGR